MTQPRHLRIDRLLYIALGIGFLPSLVLATLYFLSASQQIEHEAKQEWQQTAQAVVRDASGQLESVARTIRNFSKLRIFHVALDYERFEGLEEYFNSVVASDPAFFGLAFVDHADRVVAHSGAKAGATTTSSDLERWYEDLLEQAVFPATPGHFGWAKTGAEARHFLIYRAPIMQDGRVKGHLVGVYAPEFVHDLLNEWLIAADLPSEQVPWSFGVDTDAWQLTLATNAQFDPSAQDANSSLVMAKQVCARASGVEILPIKLCLQTKDDAQIAAAQNQQLALFGALFFSLLLFAGLVLWMVRRSNNIIRMILGKLQDLAAGDDAPLPQAKDRYTNQFVDLTNETVGRITQMNESLRKSQNYQAIARTTQMLAHDVRKPFSLLKIGLTVLANARSTDSFQSIKTNLIEEIERATTQVDSMIDDIMEIDRGQTLHRSNASFSQMLKEALFDCERLIGHKKLQIYFELNHQRCVWADRRKLMRVLGNLLSNAYEANPQGGWLRITTSEASAANGDAQLTCRISNGGELISEAQSKRLFDAFNTSKPNGTGLGLVIARKIIDAHGGTISCERSPVTTFTFTVDSSREQMEPLTSLEWQTLLEELAEERLGEHALTLPPPAAVRIAPPPGQPSL